MVDVGVVFRKRKRLVEHADEQGYGGSLVLIRISEEGLIQGFIVSMGARCYRLRFLLYN